ncbi:MAG: TldD/PmbA family protein [Firmicutes bacterium]|nr:TldD/PmbA family protein [Bacillota bacterium]
MRQALQVLPVGVQGELHTQKSTTVNVTFKDSQFEDIKNRRSTKATLRVIRDGKLAMASSSKPGDHSSLVQNVLNIAKYGTRVEHQFPAAAHYQELKLVDDAVTQVDTKTMVAIAEDLVSAVRDYDPRIQVMAGVSRQQHTTSLINTAGFTGEYQKTVWSYYLGGQLVQGDDLLWLGDGVLGCNLREDYAALKQDIIQLFDNAKTVVPFQAGSYPVIFAPSEVSYLLAPFLASLNGKAVARDISPWKDKLGEQLLDPRITLVDDGTLPYAASSQPFDREGVPTRRNVLIDQGIAKQLLLDLQFARALGLESTGNGTLAGPSPHHVCLDPGSHSLADMQRQIQRGLIIFGTMGAWANNPYSGNVSGTISLGLLIEKGEVVGRVKDCMFSINSFKHFKDHLIAISRETKDEGSATLPYVALDEVVISTT